MDALARSQVLNTLFTKVQRTKNEVRHKIDVNGEQKYKWLLFSCLGVQGGWFRAASSRF